MAQVGQRQAKWRALEAKRTGALPLRSRLQSAQIIGPSLIRVPFSRRSPPLVRKLQSICRLARTHAHAVAEARPQVCSSDCSRPASKIESAKPEIRLSLPPVEDPYPAPRRRVAAAAEVASAAVVRAVCGADRVSDAARGRRSPTRRRAAATKTILQAPGSGGVVCPHEPVFTRRARGPDAASQSREPRRHRPGDEEPGARRLDHR